MTVATGTIRNSSRNTAMAPASRIWPGVALSRTSGRARAIAMRAPVPCGSGKPAPRCGSAGEARGFLRLGLGLDVTLARKTRPLLLELGLPRPLLLGAREGA